ncbi:MAG: hypothetical protein U9M89_00270 [Patescibacteria group bacterium]|nr:hypothetical protein [Patescibacteria group bacterium]
MGSGKKANFTPVKRQRRVIRGELGVEGAKINSGYVHEEFIPALQGSRGRKVFRQMADNDPIIGSMLHVIEMVVRSVKWSVRDSQESSDSTNPLTNNGTTDADVPSTTDAFSGVEWLEGVLFADMDTSWEDFIVDVMSMLVYGWSYFEVVLKLRKGPSYTNPTFNSIFNDGTIGLRKLSIRGQETLDKWEMTDDGELLGMWQYPPNRGTRLYIPYNRALLFCAHRNKNSPEGRSVLRNAYRPWYFLKNIQEIEAIAVERELNGLPVVYIPQEVMASDDPTDVAAVAEYVKLARDIKFNEQGGAVLPSDPWMNGDQTYTNMPKVRLDLLSTNGSRAIDTRKAIQGYQFDMSRTVVADFILMGGAERGSYALSKTKLGVFQKTIEGWLNGIAAVLNRRLVPNLWDLNSFPRETMPGIYPGPASPEDLEELGEYVERLSAAGMPLFPDDDLEHRLRQAAKLPERGAEAKSLAEVEAEVNEMGREAGLGDGDAELESE